MSEYNLPVDSIASRRRDEELIEGRHSSDSSFTFRVNSELKKQFHELCEGELYSASSALKRFMLRSVKRGYITHDFRDLHR